MLTVVTGPPCVGKTTHVQTHAKPGDIVVDYDALAVALGSPDSHDHPAPVAYVAKAARQTAIRAAIGCHRGGARVWIIDTSPSPGRQRQYAKAGAQVITLTAPPEVLHARAKDRPKAWHRLIDTWLAEHGEQADPRGMRAW
ncbi:AAA family ATPase [Actinomadura sp. WMMA1423]|uniref:AAA family ATPase n=1 Tax=Actinomadura sp. WMMA1423 TaxID=2591108 RepID=UPI00114668FC|nr:AAA family ATPase [Actinomadura sp. WMMA1423]